ncbi:hypothetical protein BC835DRAFT_1412416 [Cytidiella melzeri]|nr:hypothetical protein BC835DRAFT_1412416 [Cytidiella melzeri]
MSISVDDLVASFNTSHIGQEQMDLAALQAQLAQVLFHQPIATSPSTSGFRHGACTPTARTPTHSASWNRPDFDRRRSSSVASVSSSHGDESMDAIMDDDDRMVEDLLFPASPSTSSATPAQFAHVPAPASPSHYSRHSRKSSLSTPFSQMHYDMPPSNTSIFATTDPFYLAQLQSAQAAAPSFFSQYSKTSQQSPFMKAHQFQPGHGHVFSHHAEASAFVR